MDSELVATLERSLPDKRPDCVSFDNIVFDMSNLTLWSEGQPIQIGDQPARIFKFLIEHQDRVVTRDELYALFWPGVAGGAEHNLNAAIRQIRRAIGDDGVNAKFIRTLPKRGYQAVNLAETVPTQTKNFLEKVFRRPPLRNLAALALCASVFFAINAALMSSHAALEFEISTVDSNCSDTTTQRLEKIIRSEMAVAVSETHPSREIVLGDELGHKNGGAHFSLNVLAEYNRTDGVLYVQIVDNRLGATIWTRKYAVDLNEPNKVTANIGADVKKIVRAL